MGLASVETAEKEIRNGRLAMLAFVGFASVYATRGLGPIAALKLHIENPGFNNSALPPAPFSSSVLKHALSGQATILYTISLRG